MALASGWTGLRRPRLCKKICEATYSPHCTVGGISSLRIILHHTVDFEHQLAPSWRPTGKVVEEGGERQDSPQRGSALRGLGHPEVEDGGGGQQQQQLCWGPTWVKLRLTMLRTGLRAGRRRVAMRS